MSCQLWPQKVDTNIYVLSKNRHFGQLTSFWHADRLLMGDGQIPNLGSCLLSIERMWSNGRQICVMVLMRTTPTPYDHMCAGQYKTNVIGHYSMTYVYVVFTYVYRWPFVFELWHMTVFIQHPRRRADKSNTPHVFNVPLKPS